MVSTCQEYGRRPDPSTLSQQTGRRAPWTNRSSASPSAGPDRHQNATRGTPTILPAAQSIRATLTGSLSFRFLAGGRSTSGISEG
jgi:hypothetical protein